MEVKTEPIDQSYETTSISMIEMDEKFVKLQQEFVVMKKEMAELRKENTEMKVEMARNNEKCKKQNAMLKEMVAKLNGQNNREELEMQQQSQMSMMIMENSQHNNRFDDDPLIGGEVQNEFVETDQPDEQNVDNNSFDLMENLAATIIKQEFNENAEIEETNFAVQIQTTSSNLLNKYEENQDNVQNIEKDEARMNLNRDEENGKRENGKQIDGQIKCAPINLEGMFICNWPGCKFRSLYPHTFPSHWRTHTGERPFVCAQCGKSFGRSTSLKSHIRIHSGEKPYQCVMCAKSFRHSYQLKQHKRIHTSEKPYLCKECGKSFTTSMELNRHDQRHRGPASKALNHLKSLIKEENDGGRIG